MRNITNRHSVLNKTASLQPNAGITYFAGQVANGVLRCRFHRIKSINGTMLMAQRDYNQHFFDLETDWYLMFAKGDALQGGQCCV